MTTLGETFPKDRVRIGDRKATIKQFGFVWGALRFDGDEKDTYFNCIDSELQFETPCEVVSTVNQCSYCRKQERGKPRKGKFCRKCINWYGPKELKRWFEGRGKSFSR